jgi:hypothetical protein
MQSARSCRGGHCTLTPAETIAAVQTLLNRLDTGGWHDVNSSDLNKAAAALGPNFNGFLIVPGTILPVPPAFVDFKPSRYLRPFDAETEECDHCPQRWSYEELLAAARSNGRGAARRLVSFRGHGHLERRRLHPHRGP